MPPALSVPAWLVSVASHLRAPHPRPWLRQEHTASGRSKATAKSSSRAHGHQRAWRLLPFGLAPRRSERLEAAQTRQTPQPARSAARQCSLGRHGRTSAPAAIEVGASLPPLLGGVPSLGEVVASVMGEVSATRLGVTPSAPSAGPCGPPGVPSMAPPPRLHQHSSQLASELPPAPPNSAQLPFSPSTPIKHVVFSHS